jgi:hypothetical protein
MRQLYFSTVNNAEPVRPETDLLRGTGGWTTVYLGFLGWCARPVQCAKKTSGGSGSGFFRLNRRSGPVFKTMSPMTYRWPPRKKN